jgi:hypothetical protein
MLKVIISARIVNFNVSPAPHAVTDRVGGGSGHLLAPMPRDTLFLAAPVASKGRLLQYAGRILRPYDGKATAEVHDYHDELTGVLASSLAKRAPGYTSLGFPDPASSPTPPAPTRRAKPSQRDQQHETDRGQAQPHSVHPCGVPELVQSI